MLSRQERRQALAYYYDSRHERTGLRLYEHRRRSEWWGVFYLKELWATALFAGLLIWCVVKDRQAFSRALKQTQGSLLGRAGPALR